MQKIIIIILLENPYKLFSVGFQLSYAGTIGIVLFYPKLKQKMKSIIAICLSAQILIFPITVLHFNNFSTYFILSLNFSIHQKIVLTIYKI